MSTIEDVRVAEKKMRDLVEALKKAPANDPNDISAKLNKAADQYAKAVRELKI